MHVICKIVNTYSFNQSTSFSQSGLGQVCKCVCLLYFYTDNIYSRAHRAVDSNACVSWPFTVGRHSGGIMGKMLSSRDACFSTYSISSSSEDKRLEMKIASFLIWKLMWNMQDSETFRRQMKIRTNKISFFLTCSGLKLHFGCNTWVTVDSFGINDTNWCSYLHT